MERGAQNDRKSITTPTGYWSATDQPVALLEYRLQAVAAGRPNRLKAVLQCGPSDERWPASSSPCTRPTVGLHCRFRPRPTDPGPDAPTPDDRPQLRPGQPPVRAAGPLDPAG